MVIHVDRGIQLHDVSGLLHHDVAVVEIEVTSEEPQLRGPRLKGGHKVKVPLQPSVVKLVTSLKRERNNK